MNAYVRVTVLLATAWVWSPTAIAAEESDEVAVILVTTKIALGVQDDIERIKTVFTDAAQALNSKGVRFRRPLVQIGVRNRKELFDLVDSVIVSKESTLFCYCKLHGEYKPDAGHVLYLDGNTDNDAVPRSELLKALAAHKARLTILVTDSCIAAPAMAPIPAEVAAAAFPIELFSDLFVASEGLVDLNSSEPPNAGNPAGQLAWMDADGALFTREFTRLLANREQSELSTFYTSIDKNKNRRVSWEEFMVPMRKQTGAAFQIFKESAQQRRMTPSGLQIGDATLKALDAQNDQTPFAFTKLPTDP